MKARAIGYLRVSTAEQVESGLGLDAQEERVRAYATATGLDLEAVIREEGVSGSVAIGERPGGAELLRALRRREVGHVVALKLDRLFRDAADCLNETRAWDRAGVALHLLDMGGQAVNTASAMGRMFLTMAAGFAELERNLIAERTAAALAQKRKRGEYTGGGVPFGFRLANGRVSPYKPEQTARRLVADFRARGMSFRAIARELDSRGISAKQGGRWAPIQVARVAAGARRAE